MNNESYESADQGSNKLSAIIDLTVLNEEKGFTVDSAIDQLGGFGRFQWFLLVIFIILKNFG